MAKSQAQSQAQSEIQIIRDYSDEELEVEILGAKRALFLLRFNKATRQSENKPHLFKYTRHRLAQLLTVERERQLKPQNSTQD